MRQTNEMQNKKIEDLTREISDLTKENKVQNKKIQDLTREISDLTDENKVQNKKIQDLTKENEMQNKKIQDLKESFGSIWGTISSMSKVAQQLSTVWYSIWFYQLPTLFLSLNLWLLKWIYNFD